MLNNEDTVKEIHHRVVEKQEYDLVLLKKLYEILEVEVVGETTHPTQGRIATNITQDTDKGKLLIRIYPKQMPQKLETGHPMFEIESLNFYTNHGVNVPLPLKFGERLYYETENQIIFGYFLIPGIPISQSELSVNLAKNIGEFLCNMLEISAQYSTKSSSEEAFKNSFDYILQIAEKIENKYPKLKEIDTWATMKESTKMHVNILDGTPKGIVHADYFFENILRDENDNIIGLIDFGDAYYGYILHDLVIGAMEACVLEDEIWNLEILNTFLKATSSFLKSNSISFEQFFETLKADCLRFSVYTAPFTHEDGKTFDNNPYINRYKNLLSENFQEKLHEIYNICVSEPFESNVLGDSTFNI
ncbi:MAG: phosphotransferase [Candidatus Tisiphia sp.]